MGVAQGKIIGCIRSNHPSAGKLLHEKRTEIGSTWGKKNPPEITGTFPGVKSKGRAGEGKQSAGTRGVLRNPSVGT